MTINWSDLLADQLDWHWQAQLRPRLAGLTDDEYFWEPVPHAWNVRRRGEGVAMEVGAGDFIIDFAMPEPTPPPVTTIAWRLGHLLVGVLGDRNARHFGGPPISYDSYVYPSTADEALARLDEEYARWIGGVRSVDPHGLEQPCGEHGYESDPLAALIVHINREMLHHGAEIALLRDLYAWRAGPTIM
ncbi:MAG: DinB family protein [Propionibacteriaceae bacterium]